MTDIRSGYTNILEMTLDAGDEGKTFGFLLLSFIDSLVCIFLVMLLHLNFKIYSVTFIFEIYNKSSILQMITAKRLWNFERQWDC